MNIFLTFDYELFFGKASGSLAKSIIEPTNELVSILDRYAAKGTFFVDSGYLVKLKEYSQNNEELNVELSLISQQIKTLADAGHSIQLHIHPHWEDAVYSNGQWVFNTDRFTLNSFTLDEVDSIVERYKAAIENITLTTVFAYRAGGWSIQPFLHIASAMKKHGIWLDSTVFHGGFYHSNSHCFDFKHAPSKDMWSFEHDILDETEEGYFIELPISSYKINPLFYWKFVLIKLLKLSQHNYRGDGSPIGAGKKDIIKMLIRPSHGVVSVDGYKTSYLKRAFKACLRKRHDNFVLIGHPKAFTTYSLSELNAFICKMHQTHKFISVAEPNFLNAIRKER